MHENKVHIASAAKIKNLLFTSQWLCDNKYDANGEGVALVSISLMTLKKEGDGFTLAQVNALPVAQVNALPVVEMNALHEAI